MRFDFERRLAFKLESIAGAWLTVPLIRFLVWWRYFSGRQRKAFKIYLDDTKTEYQWGWAAKGETPIVQDRNVYIDTPRPSGLMEINLQKKKR